MLAIIALALLLACPVNPPPDMTCEYYQQHIIAEQAYLRQPDNELD